MTFEIELLDRDDDLFIKYLFNASLDKCTLEIYMDPDTTLEERLSCKDEILKEINRFLDVIDDLEDEELSKIEMIKNNIDDLLSITDYIRLSFDDDTKNLNYLKEHPEISNKKIILSKNLYPSDLELASKLMHIYKDNLDNIYISMYGNRGYVKLTECYNSLLQIKDIADSILKLNLSPIETIMYTYDVVRNRVYKEEELDELPTISRNLTSVLNGNKIVCTGFANIFDALLYYMNFNVCTISLRNKNDDDNGHTRNVIYVKDEKYNIDGVYYFDPTWDCKKEGQTNEFLNSYRFFALTRNDFEQIENHIFIDDYFAYYSDNMVEEMSKLLDENTNDELKKNYLKPLNHMGRFVLNEDVINFIDIFSGRELNKEKILKKISIIQEKFDSPIPGEIFMRILATVRKVQYYQNPTFYPYSLNDFYKTFNNSNWNLDGFHIESAKDLVKILINNEVDKENFKSYAKKEKINEEIKTIKFIKLLRNYSEKRK